MFRFDYVIFIDRIVCFSCMLSFTDPAVACEIKPQANTNFAFANETAVEYPRIKHVEINEALLWSCSGGYKKTLGYPVATCQNGATFGNWEFICTRMFRSIIICRHILSSLFVLRS